MDEFNGLYFSDDLIGPDGRLARLHKGGRIAAARAQKQATLQAAADAKLGREDAAASRAESAAARQQAASQAEAANALAQESMAEASRIAQASSEQSAQQQAELLANSQKNAKALAEQTALRAQNTEYIQDDVKKRRGRGRSAFGLSSTRSNSRSNTGLGGYSSTLG